MYNLIYYYYIYFNRVIIILANITNGVYNIKSNIKYKKYKCTNKTLKLFKKVTLNGIVV